MKTLIVSLFAFVVMGCVVEGKGLDERPASTEALPAPAQPAAESSPDGAGGLGEATPDVVHEGLDPTGTLREGTEPALSCWCSTSCSQRGQGCYAECDYESGDCECVGKCY